MDIAVAIHAALEKAGLPVAGVSVSGNTAVATLADSATDAQRAAAQVIVGSWTSDSSRLAWAEIRQERDRLLAACDGLMIRGMEWYQKAVWANNTTLMAALKAAAIEWMTYRQALRDLPQAYATPEAVVWPRVPSSTPMLGPEGSTAEGPTSPAGG